MSLSPAAKGILGVQQDSAGGARTDSEQPGTPLAPSLEQPGQAGNCQAVPTDTVWVGRHFSVPPILTSLAGQVAGWRPRWAMVERAATELTAGFPPRETSIGVSVLRLQVVVVGAGKAMVGIIQARSILIPRSFSELSPSLTVFTGPITQESKISCRR